MKLTLSTVLLFTTALSFAAGLESTAKFSNCSGFLFTVEGRATEKNALIMTNGHCLDPLMLTMLKPGEVRLNRSASRDITLNGATVALKVTTQRLLYASMTKTDMAIYELPQSYQRLQEKYGITPLLLAKDGPLAGTPIHIPSSYRRRVYDCRIEAVLAGLREGGRSFEQSLRYDSDCHTISGTSGSPLVLDDGVTVVGINNTNNTHGNMCTNDNPCEVNEAGETSVIRGRSYGQQTALIYSCLNAEADLDVSVEGCELPH